MVNERLALQRIETTKKITEPATDKTKNLDCAFYISFRRFSMTTFDFFFLIVDESCLFY